MNPRRIPSIMLILLAAVFTLPAFANAQQTTFNPQVQWGNQLIGMSVENRQGARLGEIEDVLLDETASDISYAVVSSGGFLGMGGDRHVVPLLALRFMDRGENRETAFLNITAEDYDQSPMFHRSDWVSELDENMQRNVHQFYVDVDPDYSGILASHFDLRGDIRSQTLDYDRRPGEYSKLTHIVGMDIDNFNQQKLGTIEDVGIDMYQTRPVFALLGSSSLLQGREGYAPIPWQSLMIRPDEDVAMLDTNTETLAEIAASSPNIDVANRDYALRVYGVFHSDPYWVIFGYTPPERMNESSEMMEQGQMMQQGPMMQQGRMMGYGQPYDQRYGRRYERGYERGERRMMNRDYRSMSWNAWRPGGEYIYAYEHGAMQTLDGRVVSVGVFYPEPSSTPGLRLRIETRSGGHFTVQAGPREYAMMRSFDVCPGDEVRISGAMTTFDNEPVLIADTIWAHGNSYRLIMPNGEPTWNVQHLERQMYNPRYTGEYEGPGCPY